MEIELLDALIYLGSAIGGAVLKNHFPFLWPFFDKNSGKIIELLQLMNSMARPNPLILEEVKSKGYDLAHKELERSEHFNTNLG